MINPLSFPVFICVIQTLITHWQEKHCMSSGDKNRVTKKSFLLMMNTSRIYAVQLLFPSFEEEGKSTQKYTTSTVRNTNKEKGTRNIFPLKGGQ